MSEGRLVDFNAQVSEAVQAVRDRDRRTRRYFMVAIVAILVGGSIGGIIQTSILLGQTHKLTAQNEALSKLLKQGEAQREQIAQVLCLVGTNQAVMLLGLRQLAHEFGVDIPKLPGEVTQCSTEKDDVIIGTSGPDKINGTPGRDFISGLDGNDRLRGKGGADTLIAGNGKDRLYGGEGDDTLRAVEPDGRVDVLIGGPGDDTCTMRVGDRAFSCEHVTKI